MEKSRRHFLKTAATLPVLWKTMAAYGNDESLRDDVEETQLINRDHKCRFNLTRFAAPAIPNLRVGYIGMGNRGLTSMKRLAQYEGIEIRAIADCYEYPVAQAREYLKSINYPAPAEYFQSEETWKDLIARDDLDLVIVTTPQYWHAEMVCAAMEAGKHTATEVPLAYTLAECWQVVETAERTQRHCAMLENCCYDFFEAMTLNMALQGVFGEIVYGAGAYLHYFPASYIFQEPMPPLSKKAGPYRAVMSVREKGNRYPTHGFGPICKAMKVNAGDRPDYLVSMETDDFVLKKAFDEALKQGSEYHKQFIGKTFSSNLNISLMRTVKGKALQVQWDETSMRPYSRIHELSGLNGFVQKYPLPGRIYFSDGDPVSDEQMKELEAQYTPELIKMQQENAIHFGGHGGMDFICEYRLIDSLRNGLPLDITAYDAATWSAVTPLSLWSATHGSQPIPFPDFTGGTWEENAPIDLSLRGGGTTIVKAN